MKYTIYQCFTDEYSTNCWEDAAKWYTGGTPEDALEEFIRHLKEDHDVETASDYSVGEFYEDGYYTLAVYVSITWGGRPLELAVTWGYGYDCQIGGKHYKTYDQAVACDDYNGPEGYDPYKFYTAHAVCLEDQDFNAHVYWRILDDYDPACGDESNACDWSNPALAEKGVRAE